MPYGDEDLAAVLADVAGEPLWFGSQVTDAAIDEAGSVVTDAVGTEVQLLGTTARIRTGTLAGLAEESEVVRGRTGATYRVRQVLPVGDGAVTVLVLARKS